MRLLEATLPRDHDLYLLSDDHEGALAQHTAALDKVITEIAGNPWRMRHTWGICARH